MCRGFKKSDCSLLRDIWRAETDMEGCCQPCFEQEPTGLIPAIALRDKMHLSCLPLHRYFVLIAVYSFIADSGDFAGCLFSYPKRNLVERYQ